jgi:DNA-binding NarL/FixJ family response regulator
MSELRKRRGDHLRLLTGRRDHAQLDAGANDESSSSGARTPTGAIRVLVAASHTLVRAGYRALLESDDRIEVVAEAGDRPTAIRLAGEHEPNVVLIDLALAGLDDPEGIAAMVSDPALAGAAVMLIAPPGSEERVLGALQAGAVGALGNNVEPAELIGAVQLIAGGQAMLPAGAMRRLLQTATPHLSFDARVAERFEELTDREREIVALAAAGLSNGQIAERLVISTATAKTHVSRAMIKLHARHRAQLVAIAYETGLVRANLNRSLELEAPAIRPDRASRVIEIAAAR